MHSELLLKFIGYLPDYLLALSRTLLRFLWTTFFERLVYLIHSRPHMPNGQTSKHSFLNCIRDNSSIGRLKTQKQISDFLLATVSTAELQ